MDKFKSFEQTIAGKKYLTNLKGYVLNRDEKIVYTWDYIFKEDLTSIQENTSKDLMDTLKDFSIEVYRKENEKWIYASPLAIRKIQTSSNLMLAKEVINAVSLYHIEPKKNIFDYFENLVTRSKFPISRDKIYTLYREIEQIIDIDLSKHILAHPSNKEHRIHKDSYVFNPMITTQKNKVKKIFDKFIDSLTPEEKNSVLKNIYWQGTYYVLWQVSDLLYDTYHTDDINYLNYTTAVNNIKEIFEEINKSFPIDMNDEKSLHYHVQGLKDNIMEYIWSLTSKPNDKKAYEDINDHIYENIMGPFYDVIEDDDLIKKLDDDIDNLIYNIELFLESKAYATVSIEWKNNDSSNNLSAVDLFMKISEDFKWEDYDNVLNSIKILEQCEDKEISNLLSIKNLQELEDILGKNEIEEYEFAARINYLKITMSKL